MIRPSTIVASTLLAVMPAACAGAAQQGPQVALQRVSTPTTEPAAGVVFVKETARLAERAGAGALELIRFGAARAGDSIDGFVFVPKDRCALVYARGGASVEDLDLHVFGDDGTQFGADEAPDDLPTLVLCPKTSVRLYVSARVAQGEGVVALAMHDLPQGRSGAVARAVGARNFAQKPKAIHEAWPGLKTKIADHRAAVGGSWADVRRVALPVDSRVPTTISAVVPGDRCLDVFVVPDEAVAQVDVVAKDDKGRIFARAEELGSERYLVVCSATGDSPLSIVLRPHAGQGMAAVVLSATKAAPDLLDLSRNIVRYRLGAPLLRSDLPDDLPPPFARKSAVALVGTRGSVPVTTRGCARIDILPDDQLRGAELWLWDESGHMLAESAIPDLSPLFVCHEGQLRMDFSAAERKGQLSTQWVDLKFPRAAEKHLLQEPLAASRLLQLIHLSTGASRSRSLEQVEELTLSPTEWTRQTQNLPAGKCRAWFLASGRHASGIEARAFDPDSGVELDLARGRHSTSVRACAPAQQGQEVVVEMRSIHREARALLAQLAFPLHAAPPPP